MSVILNEWLPGATEDATILRMTGCYTVDVIVPTKFLEQLKPLSWCYEQCKGQVYATDMTFKVPALLGINSPRVYMWKYIIFLHTGKLCKGWRRANMNNYIPNHGSLIMQEAQELV